MKFMFILMAVLAVVVLLMVQLGMFTAEDPKEAADELRNMVKPGMTWQQVVDIRMPKKYAKVKPEALGGTSAPRKFDRAKFEQAVPKGSYPDGFTFPYTFSAAQAVQVLFDAKGTVIVVSDAPTMKDLFGPH
jgi:hypothetical protein